MKQNKPFILERYESLFDLTESTRQWMDRHSKDSVFCSFYWFALLEKNIFKEQVVVYAVKDQHGCLLLIMPCYESHDGGLELHGLTNYYSVFYAPVLAPGVNLTSLFTFFIKALKPYRYRLISFQAMDVQSKEWLGLLQGFKANGYLVRQGVGFGNCYECLAGHSFSDYWRERPSRLKNTIQRKYKKLTDCKILIKSDCSDIKKILPDYWKVYNKSWKEAEPYPEFINDMVMYYCQQGMTRIGVAYLDDQPAAAQIWFVSHNGAGKKVASIYKLAYDEQFKATSIGSILTKALFNYCIDRDKVSVVDYLSGDDAYKADWVGSRRERWGFLAYNIKTCSGISLLVNKMVHKFFKLFKQGCK